MASLLKPESFAHMTKEGRIPSMMEFPADERLTPFLVSSTRSAFWVEELSSEGNLRAAIRERKNLEIDLILEICMRSKREGWGNLFDLSDQGILDACLFLEKQGVPWEVLVPPSMGSKMTEISDEDFIRDSVSFEEWVPEECLIVVPKDRTLLGTLGVFSDDKGLAVIHNAERGIAIAIGD